MRIFFDTNIKLKGILPAKTKQAKGILKPVYFGVSSSLSIPGCTPPLVIPNVKPVLAATNLQDDFTGIDFPTVSLNKTDLYNLANEKSLTLGNPLISILISGIGDINRCLRSEDHKAYADAIFKKEKKHWNTDRRFVDLASRLDTEIKTGKVNPETVEKAEKLIEEYYILPDLTFNDEQIKIAIDVPKINFSNWASRAENSRKDEYLKVAEYIHNNWKNLVRMTPNKTYSSLIPLPNPYVIPGGRFREIYYWDSYFTALGLKNSELDDLAKGMTENFMYMVKQFGFVPNGNRTYYLSRSQPPFLALMVEITRPKDLSRPEDKTWMEHAYKVVAFEYQSNWMDKDTHYIPEIGLNRYFDPIDRKRPECFGDEIANIEIKKGFYQHERAECESGWDFSKRFGPNACDFIPVDLNSLLYKYEVLLSKWATELGKFDEARIWSARSNTRKHNMIKYLYNSKDGLFYDYNFRTAKQSNYKNISAIYPLWVGMFDTRKEADKIGALRNAVIGNFERKGGIVTAINETPNLSGGKKDDACQWAYPNGWAPLQWITIEALNNYGYTEDAMRISEKWLDVNTNIYNQTGRLFEKYNVEDGTINVTTFYPQQDGFGWTNGVYSEILNKILN